LRACWLDDDQLAALALRAEALRASHPPENRTGDRQPDPKED
jgi:hypothetical protein